MANVSNNIPQHLSVNPVSHFNYNISIAKVVFYHEWSYQASSCVFQMISRHRLINHSNQRCCPGDKMLNEQSHLQIPQTLLSNITCTVNCKLVAQTSNWTTCPGQPLDLRIPADIEYRRRWAVTHYLYNYINKSWLPNIDPNMFNWGSYHSIIQLWTA